MREVDSVHNIDSPRLRKVCPWLTVWAGVLSQTCVHVSHQRGHSARVCIHGLIAWSFARFWPQIQYLSSGNGQHGFLHMSDQSPAHSSARTADSDRRERVFVVDPRPQFCGTSATDSSGMVTTCAQGRRLPWSNLTVVVPCLPLPIIKSHHVSHCASFHPVVSRLQQIMRAHITTKILSRECLCRVSRATRSRHSACCRCLAFQMEDHVHTKPACS